MTAEERGAQLAESWYSPEVFEGADTQRQELAFMVTAAIRAAVAGAVAGEREANCKVVCDGCRDEIPLLYGELPLGGVKPYRKTWLHLWNPGGIYTECHAASIRASGEGEG
jgi:hypothetical protein